VRDRHGQQRLGRRRIEARQRRPVRGN
jgi:hypothetical protein